MKSRLILKFDFKDTLHSEILLKNHVEFSRNRWLSTLVGDRDLLGLPLGEGSCDIFQVSYKDQKIRPRTILRLSFSLTLGRKRPFKAEFRLVSRSISILSLVLNLI